MIKKYPYRLARCDECIHYVDCKDNIREDSFYCHVLDEWRIIGCGSCRYILLKPHMKPISIVKNGYTLIDTDIEKAQQRICINLSLFK